MANDDAGEVARLYEMRTRTEDDDINDALSTLSNEQKEQRRLSRKPSIDHLQDATVMHEGACIPLFNVGDKIVAERKCMFLKDEPWLDTNIYVVKSINDAKGYAACYNEETQQNVIIGFNHPSTRVKLCPKKGNPFRDPNAPEKTVRRRKVKRKVKRGRRK